jgi:hypothetical protein
MTSSSCLSEVTNIYEEMADSTFGAQRGAILRMQSREGSEEDRRLHRITEDADGGSRQSVTRSGVGDGRVGSRHSAESASSGGRRRLPATPSGPSNLLLLPHVLSRLPESRLTTPMCSSTGVHRDDAKRRDWRSSCTDGSQKVSYQLTVASPRAAEVTDAEVIQRRRASQDNVGAGVDDTSGKNNGVQVPAEQHIHNEKSAMVGQAVGQMGSSSQGWHRADSDICVRSPAGRSMVNINSSDNCNINRRPWLWKGRRSTKGMSSWRFLRVVKVMNAVTFFRNRLMEHRMMDK